MSPPNAPAPPAAARISVPARAAMARAGVPVIGIGAGPGCSGQVRVMYDALGIQPGRPAPFVRQVMDGSAGIESAPAAYCRAVEDGSIPAAEHCFRARRRRRRRDHPTPPEPGAPWRS